MSGRSSLSVSVAKGLDGIGGTDVSWRSLALTCERVKWGGEAQGWCWPRVWP